MEFSSSGWVVSAVSTQVIWRVIAQASMLISRCSEDASCSGVVVSDSGKSMAGEHHRLWPGSYRISRYLSAVQMSA